VRRIPDLHYAVDLLLTGGDHVACRLAFDCTPQGEFLGVAVVQLVDRVRLSVAPPSVDP
jgi:predicted ester cyclase